MAWSVTETCLSEQSLLGQHWTQVVRHVHCVSLESIPVTLSCQPAQISACSGSLWKEAREHMCRMDAQETRHFEKGGRVPAWLCACSAQEERAESSLYLQYLLL